MLDSAVMRWIAVVVIAGCGPVVVAPHGETGTDHTSGATPTVGDAATSESASGATTIATTDPTTPSADTSTSEADSAAFIVNPDGGGAYECSTWEQDCPPGDKCMPWANDGGGAWNATRCTPLAEDPNEVGEPCTVVSSGVSGIDDCVIGAMCWDVHPDTLMGECIALCQGSEGNPMCADPCTHCVISSEGAFAPCLPGCDPILQNCAEGEACYPVQSVFACAPDVSGDAGAIGDDCGSTINGCDPGLLCLTAELVPGCDVETCCTAFCDVDAADECEVLLPGTSCVPWSEDEAPQGCITGTVGACMLAR